MLQTARSLLEEPRITAGGLFQIAEKIRPENVELARTLFFGATQRGIESPQEAAFGFHVGINLGLDDHVGHLMEKAVAAIGKPDAPLTAISIEDLIEMIRERGESRSEIEEQYQRGEIPIHGFAKLVGEPLAALIHVTASRNEASEVPPSKLWSIRVRYGAWRRPRAISKTSRFGLYLDITSLFLAAHLDILDTLEAEFAPISISSWVMESMRGQLETITSGQPARVAPKEEVLALVAEDRLKLLDADDLPPACDDSLVKLMGSRWCALLARVRELQGWLIDSLPLTSHGLPHEPVSIPEGVSAFLRGPGDLLVVLQHLGDLSAEQIETARLRLGAAATSFGTTSEIQPQMSLVLEIGLAEQLAYAGLLRPLTARAIVIIQREEAHELRRELAGLASRDDLSKWLRGLKERVRTGLEAGRYIVEANPESIFEVPEKVPSEIRCLRDFVNRTRPPSILSCCDDRMLSRITEVGESRVVGLFDVLWHVHRKGVLSASSLFGTLHKFRAANARFLPLTAEEIVHHVCAARVVNGKLIETRELVILRGSFAACLLDYDRLQRLPSGDPNALKFSEIIFIPGQQRIATEAIVSMWKDPSISKEMRVAGSDWVLTALWFDLAAMPLFSKDPSPLVETLLGMSDAHLIIEAMSLDSGKTARAAMPLRRAFINWFLMRIGTEPRRLERLSGEIKRTLISLVNDRKNPTEREDARKIVGGFFISFPDELRAAIHFSKAELRILEWESFPPVTFENVQFDGNAFWPAAEAAASGKSTMVSSIKPRREEFKLSSDSVDGRIQLMVTGKSGTKEFRLSDAVLELLQKQPSKRLDSLNKLRRELDFSVAQAKTAFPKLARNKRVDLRMKEIVDLRLSSVASQLRSVRGRLMSDKRFDISLAHPLGVKPLLYHLRLPSRFADGELPARLEAAAKVLLEDEGFFEAFERCASLPVVMPQVIADAWQRLGGTERQKWVDTFGRRPSSPMLGFHMAALLLRGSENEQLQAAKILVGLTSSEAREEWKLFECILTWAHASLLSVAEKSHADTAPLLAAAWIHAARLHQLLAGGSDSGGLETFFREHTPANSVAAFDRPTTRRYDVAHPAAFSVARLFVTGLSHTVPDGFASNPIVLDIQPAILALLYPDGIDCLPDVRLLEQRQAEPNCLGSFFGSSHSQGLESLLGPETGSRFSDERLEAEANAYIAAIIESPSQPANWICLSAYLKSQPASETQQASLSNALGTLSFRSLIDPTFDQLRLIAKFYFTQAVYVSGGNVGPAMEQRFIELTEVLADPARRYDSRAGGLLLGNCAFLASHASADSEEGATLFANWTTKAVELWSETAEILVPQFLDLLLRQPSTVQFALWQSAVLMRSTARRLHCD